MTTPLSERMIAAAREFGIEPPSEFENIVVTFGRGIGDLKILKDLDSALYRGIKEKYSKDYVLNVLTLILEIDLLSNLTVERTLEAHKYVKELDSAGGNDSAKRMLAHMSLGPNQMKNSVASHIKVLKANIENLGW